jgi:predicted Fe-Mo cluster-binding NifX family protein
MSDSASYNDGKQKSRKCVTWGNIAIVIASSVIGGVGGGYFYSSISNTSSSSQSVTAEIAIKPEANVQQDSQTAIRPQANAAIVTGAATQEAKQGLKKRGIDADWVRKEDWESVVDKRDVEGLRYLIAVESGKKLVMNTHRIMNHFLVPVCKKGHTEIVEVLIENGADVNIADKDGTTPLIHAASNGHTETVKLLIKGGAKVNQCNNSAESPLLCAAMRGHAKTSEVMLEAWADVNIADKDGRTALYYAIEKPDFLKLLIANGADVNKKFKMRGGNYDFYWTPLKYASVKNQSKTVELLKAAGAKE